MSSIDSRRSARQQARDEAAARERAENRARAEQGVREAQARRAAKRDAASRPEREAKPEKRFGARPTRPVREDAKPSDRPPIGSRDEKFARDDRAERRDTGRPRVEAARPDRSEPREPARRSARTAAATRRRDAERSERPRPERSAALKRADTRRPAPDRERSLRDSASAGSDTARPDTARPAATRSEPPPSARPEPSPGPARAVLESRLSSGVLSGSLPWLITRGARLMTVDGDALVLHGLNAPSFEAGLADWPFNLVRVAQKPERLAGDAMATADAAIARNAARGAYTAFALRLAASAVADPAEDPLTRLASRYVDEPAVLFALSPPAEVSDERNLALLQNALVRLRAVHPRALAIVEAAALPDDDAAWPVRGFGGSADDAIPNLVYGAPPASACVPRLRAIARRLPLCLAGWPQAGAGLREEALLGSLAADGIGWTAALPPSGHWTEATHDAVFVQRALTLVAVWDAALPRAA